MQVSSLDHLVLTVVDIEATVRFYSEVLGMQHRVSREGRHGLHFGMQKVNLHQRGHEFEPKAALPTPGSADLCFLTDAPVEEILQHLAQCGLSPLEGPVAREGAQAKLLSIYIRDPDSNLIEIASYTS